jgi:hypothetical protein
MRLHRTVLGLTSVLAATLMACAAESTPSRAEDDATSRAIDAAEAEKLFDAVDENCAGNDNGNFRRFDPKTFDAAKIMAEVKNDDRDAMGVGCFGDHAYSTSKASAVEMFDKHLAENEFDDRTCLEENLTKEQNKRLRQMIADPTNLGVFASVYDGHGDGNSEGCAYYTFHVYRHDGVHVKLTFNHTD